MKLKVQIEDREQDLTVKFEDGHIAAEVGGRVYDLQVRQPSPDSFLFFLGASVYECRVSKRATSKEVFDVDIRGRNYAVTIVDPKRLRSGQNSDRHHHGVTEIQAPMPGKVVRVDVEAGASIEKGAGIVVVEAMKMQNEMKATRAGRVVTLAAVAGGTVNAGEILATIE